MLAARIELMQQMPVFGAIADDTIEFLLGTSALIDMPAGGFFFHEDDPASSMYVLESGSVVVTRTWEGQELLLRRFGPGDCFGEMALLDLFPRSATVQAETRCLAIELSSAALYKLFQRNAAQFALIQMNIAREMSRRLRATDEQLFRARMGEPVLAPSPVQRAAGTMLS